MQKYKRLTIIFSSTFVFLNIVDLVETKIALSRGLIEINPLANYLFKVGFGEPFKIIAIIVVIFCLYRLYKLNPKQAYITSCIVSSMTLAVVIWNLIQLCF